MGKEWAIIKREYVERVRNKWFVIATLFGPLLFGALMFVPAILASRSQSSADLRRIIILDATGTDLGKRVAAELNGGITGDTSLTQVRAVPPDRLAAEEADAERVARARRVKGYLVLDSTTLRGHSARYAGSNAAALRDVQELTRVLREQVLALRLERAGLDPLQSASLSRLRFDLKAERITGRGRGASGEVSAIFAFSVAILLYVSIFVYGQNVLRGVIEEKQSRVAEVVIANVPATKLLAGKVLGIGAVGLTQIVLWGAVSLLMLKLRAPLLAKLGVSALPLTLPPITVKVAVTLLLFFVLGYTFYAALFAAIGAMVSSEQEAQQAQLPIVLLLVMSVALMQPVIARPDGAMAVTLSWLPFSAPIVMPLRLSLMSVRMVELVGSLLSLTVACWGAVWVAARIYRIGLLMYGKHPSLAELARWVRYAR